MQIANQEWNNSIEFISWADCHWSHWSEFNIKILDSPGALPVSREDSGGEEEGGEEGEQQAGQVLQAQTLHNTPCYLYFYTAFKKIFHSPTTSF